MKPNNFPLKPSLDGSEELYTQTNGVSQKFTLEATKGFITEPTDITYSELYSKIINEELVAGSWYRLTDYKNVNFLNGWAIANNNPTPTDPNFNPQEIFTGETEILLLQAISSSEISPVAYSETFPQDIITYQAYTNKIGVNFEIENGGTLPNSNIVSGFDLQWDGTNVYFDMPVGYPALYGHYFYIYCEFNGGDYYQDGTYEPLTPKGVCQYPNTNDDPDYGYPKKMSKIRLENGGNKVVLLDLTENDYLKYDADTLYVEHIYALGDAYGWITRRIDTQSKIDVPFDFRSKTYRRFEVNLSAINVSLGTGYYGQGDDYLGKGTTGNYKDLLSIDWKGYEIFDLEIGGQGGADMNYNNGYCDNIVFLGYVYSCKIKRYCFNNTIGNDSNNNFIDNEFHDNVIGDKFIFNTIKNRFAYNKIGTVFSNNNIGNSFSSNVIEGEFQKNIIGNDSYANTIGDSFNSNTIGNDSYANTIGVSFNNNTIGNAFYQNSIGDGFNSNIIETYFNSNNIGNNFRWNTIGNGFQSNSNIGSDFQLNTVGDFFQSNTIGSTLNNNIIGNYFISNDIGNDFFNNSIGNYFQSNTIGNAFIYNEVKALISSTDFTSATHVYGDYDCKIFKRSNGTFQLSYIDGTNTIQYAAINS